MSTDSSTNSTFYNVQTEAQNNSAHVDNITATYTMSNITSPDRARNIFSKYDLASFMQEFCPVANNVDRVATVIWYIIGFTGNILAAKIWLEKRMRTNNSSAVYLATLSISDLLFLVLHTLQESQYAWGHKTLNHAGLCESYFMFYFVVQYLSPILVLAFTCERWIAVCHPFSKERFCTTRRATCVVILLVFICFALGSMQAYLWKYDAASDVCEVRVDAQKGATSLWDVWTWTTEMLVFAVVPLVILTFNILVIREVRHLSRNGQRMMISSQSQNNKSAATTVMLLSVSFYVIITVLPATIVYAIVGQFPPGNQYMTEDQIRNDPTWKSYFGYITFRKFIEEICISHYACNFFLYLLTGPLFRKSFYRMLQSAMPKKFIKEESCASLNSEGTQKTSLRNVYTPVAVNGKDITKV